MFGKKKPAEGRFIIAVKDYANIANSIKAGSISLPYSKEVYLKIIESATSKLNNLKDLGKYAKANGKIKKEVAHFWENLVTEGYTLINVGYIEKAPSIEQICSNDSIRFVCKV